MATKIYLVRHGSTDFNHEDKHTDKIRGWINVPLNDKGRAEAQETAEELKDCPIDTIFSSDLIRAFETAYIIDKYHGKEITAMSALRPWNLGDYQGKVTATILDDLNAMIQNENMVPKNGEPFKQFRERYLGAIDKIVRRAVIKNDTTLIATHYRNLKAVSAWEAAGFPKDFTVDVKHMMKDQFDPGEAYEFPLEAYLKARRKK